MKLPKAHSTFYFRPILPSDAEFFFQLNEDPDVIKWTGDGPFESVDAAREFIERYDQYEKYGVGRLCLVDSETDEILGWCGLKYHVEGDFYDLGYRFFKRHWGKGLATASSLLCLQQAFEELGLKEVIGRVAIGNDASEKVLQKCGMTFRKIEDCHHLPAKIYSITAEEYFNR